MNIYVVRWRSVIYGEEDYGNFEICYSSEEEAKKALQQDYNDTKSNWIEAGEKFLETIEEDYRSIWTRTENGIDTVEWWIDKLELKNT